MHSLMDILYQEQDLMKHREYKYVTFTKVDGPVKHLVLNYIFV